MTKFKVGDYVEIIGWDEVGVIKEVDPLDTYETYRIGDGGFWYSEDDLKLKPTITLNEYQDFTDTTLMPSSNNAPYLFMGLASEASELMEHLLFKNESIDEYKERFLDIGKAFSDHKKLIRDSGEAIPEHFVNWEAIPKELGDVMYYVAQVARIAGYSLEDIARMNMEKLQSRKDRGVITGNGDER